jgi:hypothetical protein
MALLTLSLSLSVSLSLSLSLSHLIYLCPSVSLSLQKGDTVRDLLEQESEDSLEMAEILRAIESRSGDGWGAGDEADEIKCDTTPCSSNPPLAPETPKQISEAMRLMRLLQGMSETSRVRSPPPFPCWH